MASRVCSNAGRGPRARHAACGRTPHSVVDNEAPAATAASIADFPASEFRTFAEALVAGLTLPWQESPPRDLRVLANRQIARYASAVMDQWGPSGDESPSGAVLGAGASYSVAYQRNHSRSQRPNSAPAAELPVGRHYASKTTADGSTARLRHDQRALRRVGARRRPDCAPRLGALERLPSRLAGAQRPASRRHGAEVSVRRPQAGQRLAAASCRRLALLTPDTVGRGQAHGRTSRS
jgi:hypothetical protein